MSDPRDILAQRMRAMQRPAAAVVPIIVTPPAPPSPPVLDPDATLTLEEAAKLLKMSIPTLKKTGIPIMRVSPRILRIRRADMERFLVGCVLQN